MSQRGVTFYSLLVTRWNLLGTCCRSCPFQKITRYTLPSSLVTHCKKSLVTRCKICSLLVVEVARCRNSLVTRCRSCSLQKIPCYSLPSSLVTRCRSCSLQKITRYSLQNLLATRDNTSLVTQCKKSFVTP